MDNKPFVSLSHFCRGARLFPLFKPRIRLKGKDTGDRCRNGSLSSLQRFSETLLSATPAACACNQNTFSLFFPESLPESARRGSVNSPPAANDANRWQAQGCGWRLRLIALSRVPRVKPALMRESPCFNSVLIGNHMSAHWSELRSASAAADTVNVA